MSNKQILYCLLLQSMQGIINSIVRPTMTTYSIRDLGPNSFQIQDNDIKRIDTIVQTIPVSYYQAANSETTIVYAHSYNSNQLEATSIVKTVLQHHINVLTFDFQRVQYHQDNKKAILNHKQGYISFGFYEYQQLQIVIKWLKTKNKGKIWIWGRSMGAVCALLYESKSQQCDGLILDSPFHSLKQTFVNQISQMSPLPRFMSHSIVFICNQYFKKLLKFDLSELDILKHIKIKCPTLIIVNPKDSLTGQSSKLIYNKCQGYRKLYFSQAQHSGSRQRHIIEDIMTNISVFYKPVINKYLIKQASKTNKSNSHFTYFKIQSQSLQDTCRKHAQQKAKTKVKYLKIYQSQSPRQRLITQTQILPTEQKQTFKFCSE